MSSFFVKLLHDTQYLGGDNFFDDFEIVLIYFGKVIELVQEVLLIGFACFIDESVIPESVNAVVLFVLLYHNDIVNE